MERFGDIYRVTEDFIAQNTVSVMEDGGGIVGFYAVVAEGSGGSLEYLFIEPKSIGKRYGKALWDHMARECRRMGFTGWISYPDYRQRGLRKGATPAGEADSLVGPGRRMPRLIYDLDL